jgi:hypothetical protein
LLANESSSTFIVELGFLRIKQKYIEHAGAATLLKQMMNKKTIRKLFVGVMIFLPLQYAVVGIVGLQDAEPWPAFVFPGFKSVPVFDDAFETEQKIFKLVPETGQADVMYRTPAELFSEIPVSQISGFIRQNFSDERDLSSISDDGKVWLLNKAEHSADVELKEISLSTVMEYRRFKNGGMVLDSTAILHEQMIIQGD